MIFHIRNNKSTKFKDQIPESKKSQPTQQAAKPFSIPNSPSSVITLDVGGRNYKTLLCTLTSGSGYFQARYTSGTWLSEPQEDGSYFIDADPHIFEHLLRFMRRPESFPLFWSKESGYDYDLYQRVGEEAQFFKMNKLSKWIERQGYLYGIKHHTDVSQKSLGEIANDAHAGNQDVTYDIQKKVRLVYLCLRGITVHRGKREKCEALCGEAQEEYPIQYEEEYYTEVAAVVKSTQLNRKVFDASKQAVN